MTFDKTPFDIKFEFCSLEEAIADWLKYLGVAHTAYSFYNSNLGHELRVSLSDGGPDHDLTHVGVGVSQILPILVMSLLAEEDTTLIFEQPDLHLHPKVQSYLADFFLSISLSGKQCIIETHSEHIINRFRYRAAAEDDNINRIIDNLIIYSVENFEGLSKFRELKVNEFGVIKDWPKGFFDQSQLESQSIVLAALKKIKNGR
jgi:predicted ATPase